MAKVAPKQQTKAVASKATTHGKPEVSAKDAAAKAKADRQKLVESLAPEVASTISSFKSADEKREGMWFEIVDEVKAIATTNQLTKDEGRELIKLAMAEAYEVDADAITLEGQPTLYSNLSKIVVMVFPKSTAAEKALAKARAKGVTVNNALLIARGKMLAAPVSKGKGKDATGNKAKKNGKDVIDDDEIADNEISALFARMIKGGYTTDQISERVAAVLAEYEETEEGEEETED